MLKIKRDINQQDFKIGHLHFVKFEFQLQVGENSNIRLIVASNDKTYIFMKINYIL